MSTKPYNGSISYSGANKYKTCSWMFYREYVLKKKPPFIRKPAFDIGNVADQLIEFCVKDGIEAALEDFDNNKPAIIKKYPGAIGKLEDIKQMVTNAYIRLLNIGFNPNLPHEFQYNVARYPDKKGFTSRIDFIFISNKGKVVVIDWKTSNWDYTAHQIRQSDQLKLACYLLRKEGKYNPTHYGYIVMNKKNLEATRYVVQFTEEDMKYIEEDYNLVKRGMREGHFYKNTEVCSSFYGDVCPHYEACWGGEKKILIESSQAALPVINLGQKK